MKFPLICLLFLVGCAGTQAPVRPMPKFATERGKECARICQKTYAECNLACSQMIGGRITAKQRQHLERSFQ